MDIKISALPSATEVTGNDESPGVQYGSTKKFSMSQISGYILNTFSSLSLGGITQTVKSAIDSIATLLGSSPMGTTSTTVTGAIAEHSTKIGSAEMGTTATTLTGAIAEHENDITTLNSNLSTITPYTITTASGYASSVSSNLISCYKRSDGMVFVFGSFTLSSGIPSAATANIFEGFPVSRFGTVWVSVMHVPTKETLRIQFRNGTTSAALKENYTAYASGEYVVLPFSYLS